MKARTHYLNGDNHYEIYFAYEDFYGGERFTSFDEMVGLGSVPNRETRYGYLVCYLHSFYYGVTERVDMIPLDRRPTIENIRMFMYSCKNFVRGKQVSRFQVA